VCQTSILSSQGHFRIHFDSTGDNAGSLLNQTYQKIPNTAWAYADSVAEILEYVWQKEILEMGYPAPPADGGIGGDDAYDVYIKEYNGFYYGETYPDSVLNPSNPAQLSSSFIQMDNDYSDYYSKGLDGVRVTAAHEFFHSIQIGNYRLWTQDASPFFYEISSTWMEDKVYPAINDYLQYMSLVFSMTDVPLNRANGIVEYGRAIFAKYLERRFGQSIIHDIWDAMRTIPSLDAIILTLHNQGTSLESEYPEYALWYYYTGTRADTAKYFPDGYLYPAVKFYDQIEFIPPGSQSNYEMNQLAFKYFQVINNKDTATLVATNVNIDAALNNTLTPFSFKYIIRSDGGGDGFTRLPNGWWIKLEAEDPTMWKSIAFLQSDNIVGEENPYPNPFIADGMRQIVFPLWLESANAELAIYSSDLREIYRAQINRVDKFGKEMIQWNGVMNNGVLAPSGVYYYMVTVKGDTHRGKIAILKR
jgi:hypothetical protein